MPRKRLSVVVSVYDEEKSLTPFYNETLPVLENLPWDYELIFVNDGSTDGSLALLRTFAKENRKVKIINFSRNFGHESAMIAGVDYATGDGVVCMDADLQHPPASIPRIVEQFEAGYDVVSMVRTSREDGSFLMNCASKLFYKFLNLFSPVKFENNASDFLAFTKPVAKVLKTEYRDRVRYLRGYVQSVGFAKTTLEFKAGRRVAGTSKYSLRKLISFSVSTLCSFSDVPLKLGLYSGFGVALLGLALMLYTIIEKLVWGTPGGYATIIVAMCFLAAVILTVIGIIGQYISIVFGEIKNRPIYIVQDVTNLDASE